MHDDFEQCYRAMQSRDGRFDGWFVTAVASTGIYCRPSCPAITPKRRNISFLPTAAAAQQLGYRACKRCRPDASPGSPEWNTRADLVGRAMRLIADGVVDRDGVPGLARRLNYSERHLTRQLSEELGAGPLALARAQRAQTARLLIETTTMSFTDVAFAAGFASVRQFNDTVRAVFASSPTELRAARRPPATGPKGATGATDVTGTISLRLPVRPPFHAASVFGFLGLRAVPGVEEWDGTTYRRVLALPHGAGVVALRAAAGHVACDLRLHDGRDLAAAVQRCRRLLDLDADPVAVDAVLGADPVLARLVAAAPGRRSPGHVDGSELALRAVLGQQVSVVGARTIAGRLAVLAGTPLAVPDGTLTHAFPTPGQLLELPDDAFPMPVARRRALRALGDAIETGNVAIDPGADVVELRRDLLALPGIGPWTVDYVLMRALGDPDVFLATDLGVRHAAARLGIDDRPAGLTAAAERWRPWRSYALHHLWATLEGTPS